jgi:hypothetical protein
LVITQAFEQASRFSHLSIQVIVISEVSYSRLTQHLHSLCNDQELTTADAIIGLDPVRRHVALGLSQELGAQVGLTRVNAWLAEIQDDLYCTHWENAVSTAILSLAMVLGSKTRTPHS